MRYLIVLAAVLTGCVTPAIRSAEVESVEIDNSGCWCYVHLGFLPPHGEVMYRIPCPPTTKVGSSVGFVIHEPE